MSDCDVTFRCMGSDARLVLDGARADPGREVLAAYEDFTGGPEKDRAKPQPPVAA